MLHKSKKTVLGLKFRVQREWDVLKISRVYLKEKSSRCYYVDAAVDIVVGKFSHKSFREGI